MAKAPPHEHSRGTMQQRATRWAHTQAQRSMMHRVARPPTHAWHLPGGPCSSTPRGGRTRRRKGV
eukprot:641636-Pelagomonas_calceolata.AAC.9